MCDPPPFVDVLTEHFYLFSRYLIPEDFIDRLVSENVLTLDDKEVISNQYIHQNRRQRTNKLIEILMTRGENGYQKFLEILEYQYPHVYTKVTNLKPRTPPADFLPSRMSNKLRIIDSLPKLAQHIKEQFFTNAELDAQLTVLQQFLEVSKEENNALEQEIENMRGIRQENEALHMKIANLENEVRENQIAINKEMQRTLTYIEARDCYQQRWEKLQVEKDELYRRYKAELENRSPSVRKSAENLVPEQDSSRDGEMKKHYYERQKILESDLEMYKTQCEELSDRLTLIQQNETHIEKELEDKKKDLSRKEREIRALEKQLIERNVKIDSFFNLIKKKDTAIYELNKQRMDDQERYNELSREKGQIFDQNYELEKQLKKQEEELCKLKARLSGSSQGEGSSTNSGSDEESWVERRKQGFKFHGRYEKVEMRYPSLRGQRDLMSDSLQGIEDVWENPSIGKASTLPNSSDTPTEIFQREVLWLRNSLRNGSMTTQPESYHNLQHTDKPTRDESLSGLTARASVDTAVEPVNEGTQKPEPKTNVVTPILASPPKSRGKRKQSDGDLEAIPHMSPDFPSHDVYTLFLPKRFPSVVRPEMLDKDLRTVTVKFPVLNEKIEIHGGNHTGIYISKVLKNVDVTPGEEIKEVIFTPNDHVRPLVTSLKGCTLEEVHRLFSEEFIRPRKEREVRIKVRRCAENHESMKRWLAENNNTGDYYFIRCNISLESKTDEEINLRAGDVFLVRDSFYNPQKRQWRGHRVDLFTNLIDEHTDVLIPNRQESNIRRLTSIRQNSTDEDPRHFGRGAGFKVRGWPYDRVLPMKAFVKLPVHVIGPSELVTCLLEHISSKLYSQFHVQQSEKSQDDFSAEMCSNNIHTVAKGKIDLVLSRRSVQRILILVCVTQELSQDEARLIFGSGFHGDITTAMVDQCSNLRQKLKDLGHYFEEISVQSVHNEKLLLQEFTNKVKGSQDRVLWLSSKEMDPDIANRHREILGPSADIHDLNAQLQDAQSFDSTTLN